MTAATDLLNSFCAEERAASESWRAVDMKETAVARPAVDHRNPYTGPLNECHEYVALREPNRVYWRRKEGGHAPNVHTGETFSWKHGKKMGKKMCLSRSS